MNVIIAILLSSMLTSCATTQPNNDYDTGLNPGSVYWMRKNCTGKSRSEVEEKLGKAIEIYKDIGRLDKKEVIGEVYKTLSDPQPIETTMDEWDYTYKKFKLKKHITMIRPPMRLTMFYYPGGDTVVGCSSNFKEPE